MRNTVESEEIHAIASRIKSIIWQNDYQNDEKQEQLIRQIRQITDSWQGRHAEDYAESCMAYTRSDRFFVLSNDQLDEKLSKPLIAVAKAAELLEKTTKIACSVF